MRHEVARFSCREDYTTASPTLRYLPGGALRVVSRCEALGTTNPPNEHNDREKVVQLPVPRELGAREDGRTNICEPPQAS